jgi:hypothetical protein
VRLLLALAVAGLPGGDRGLAKRRPRRGELVVALAAIGEVEQRSDARLEPIY